jgi:predicted RNA polymerase sigma factor
MGPEFLAFQLLGLRDAAAPARYDREGRLVVDHENRSHRRRRMLIAILDEGVDIGEAHLVGAGRNAGDRLERGRRLVDDDA